MTLAIVSGIVLVIKNKKHTIQHHITDYNKSKALNSIDS